VQIDAVFGTNTTLSDRLINVLEAGTRGTYRHQVVAASDAEPEPGPNVDVVAAMGEINNQHGTGPLLKRVLKGRQNLFSIRSRNTWGEQDFADWNVCIPQQDVTRPEAFMQVLDTVGSRQVGQVLCVPFLADELITSIAVKECYNAHLAVYLMDDQNIASHTVSDELTGEFLSKCSIRFATHPELRTAYERKYGLKFYLLPAVVPEEFVPGKTAPAPPDFSDDSPGALIGSFWDQSWFDRLCNAFDGADCRVDWYGNNRSPWLEFPDEELQRAGITAHGLLPERGLTERLRSHPYVIVPVGSLDGTESNKGVAQLSLPGRILFALATAQIPVLLIGSENTCGSRFVRHFDIGEVVPYSAELIREAVNRLKQPEVQHRMRTNAAALGPRLSDQGVPEWLRKSIDTGEPADSRFEDLFADYDPSAAVNAVFENRGTQAAPLGGSE